MTCEYCDLDVYLNVKLFYKSAGFRVLKDKRLLDPDLLVVLRGDKEISDHEYAGIVHAYDYVREYKIEWKERFPKAKKIFVISPTPPDFPDGVTYVKGYLPVIPELWQSPIKMKDSRPVHISHFKPMGEDRYQQDLLKLIKSGLVRVYGKKWDKAGIKAKPLSYWQVNRMFAASSCCYGLMYPYQRGKTLSGRMWQAPLKGCFVISEAGTNIAGCPGVIEVSGFNRDNIAAIDRSIDACKTLSADATRYWKKATQRLADELGLNIIHVRHISAQRIISAALSRLHFETMSDHFFVNINSKNKKYVLVDLGANKGSFLKQFLKGHSISKAVLIEANPSLSQELVSDFADKSVFVVNAAIGARSFESVPFYLSNNQEASSLNRELAKSHGLKEDSNQVCVKMITLKEACSLFELEKIDLLKVDIEGAEYDLLENFSKEDFKKIDQISIEFHDFIDPSLRKRTEDCINKLRGHGYLFSHIGTPYMYGSPYYNCLFFKKRIAILGLALVLYGRIRGFIANMLGRCLGSGLES